MNETVVLIGRRNGRTRWVRLAAEFAALRGEHIHVLARDGSAWGLTSQPVGFLYARLRPC